MKVKLQPREKIIVAIAIVAVLGYGFYTYWYTPYQARIVAAKQQLAQKEAEIRTNKQLAAQLSKYKAQKDTLAAKALILQQQLPAIDAKPSVVADIKAVFENNGATVKRINLETAAVKGADPSLDVQTVNIEFNANYGQAFAIVKELETNTKRTYTVGDFSLKRDSDPQSLSGSITVQAYFAKTPLPGYQYKPSLETQGKADPFAQ